ncbi:MAG: magnesium chelatase ATPase subunit D, partial [Alphaproteobacteria bacterium]|nr:magnesium chelatase ATPase subunit D [Alphaproteobacteria bacterium]
MTGVPASSPAQASREPAKLEQESAWSFACQAAALFAIDPRLGGVALHAGAGPVRDAWLDFLRSLLPLETPFRRMPLGIGDERLLGGLDLAATLRAGRVISQMGLLAEAHQGLVIMPMAERVSAATAARIAHAFDRGEVIAEREG